MGFLSNLLGKAADKTYAFASEALAIQHWLANNPEAKQAFDNLGVEPDFWRLPDSYNNTRFEGGAVVVDGKNCYTVGEAKQANDASNAYHGRDL